MKMTHGVRSGLSHEIGGDICELHEMRNGDMVDIHGMIIVM